MAESFDLVDNKRGDGHKWPRMTKTLGDFKLNVEPGQFHRSEILVMLGQNGTGKTTFIRMLAGLLQADDPETTVGKLNISYKPQKIAPKFPSTVRMLLHSKLRGTAQAPQFVADVMKPMNIDDIIDQEVDPPPSPPSARGCGSAAQRCLHAAKKKTQTGEESVRW